MHIHAGPSDSVAITSASLRRSRDHGIRTRGAGAAVAMLACVVLISACGSSSSPPARSTATASSTVKKSLDTHRVAAAIEQSIFSKRHLRAKVSCPAVVPQVLGGHFVCIAKTHGGQTRFAVIQQNGNGYVTYEAQ